MSELKFYLLRPSGYIYLIVCIMILTGSHRPVRTFVQVSNGYISAGARVENRTVISSEDKTSVVRKRYFYLFADGQLIVSGHFLPNLVETFHRATG